MGSRLEDVSGWQQYTGARAVAAVWDARDLHIYSDGARVSRAGHLSFLSVTADRQLHIGEQCALLRRKVQPRTAQLVTNGHVRGALEYAAATWLPAASDSRSDAGAGDGAAARVITGCPVSTPVDPLMAEVGMLPMRVRREPLSGVPEER